LIPTTEVGGYSRAFLRNALMFCVPIFKARRLSPSAAISVYVSFDIEVSSTLAQHCYAERDWNVEKE